MAFSILLSFISIYFLEQKNSAIDSCYAKLDLKDDVGMIQMVLPTLFCRLFDSEDSFCSFFTRTAI